MLEGLNDPENLGLIARSARAFGIDALVLDPTCIDPYYRRTVRVSMGEVLLLPVARFTEWPTGVDTLPHGFETWAFTPAADADDLWTCARPPKVALLFGAEGPGLPRRNDAPGGAARAHPDRAGGRLDQRRARRGCRLRRFAR